MSEGLPNYQGIHYRQQAPLWAYLDDVFRGIDAWTERSPDGSLKPTDRSRCYLPQEPAEDGQDYHSRLIRTPFDDRFAAAIRKFINLVFANGVTFSGEFPDFDSLDVQGRSGNALLREVAIAAMRRGHTFLLIDYPPIDPTVYSQADHAQSGRCPYWVHYPAPDVLFWKTEKIGGQLQLSQVTLRERRIIPGEFQEAEQEVFRIYRRLVDDAGPFVTCELYAIAKGKDGKESAVLLEQPQVLWLDYPLRRLPFIPLVPVYAGLREGFYCSRPPLRGLADLNIAHYQTRSDHRNKVRLCSMPVPELRDSMRPEGEPLVLGPTTFVHIRDPQGSFNWKEPLATSLEQSRREVLDLEAAMDVLSAAYLSKPGNRQSATTTLVQTKEIESTLTEFTAAFSEGIDRALAVHAAYKASAPVQLQLSGEILHEEGSDSQMFLALIGLAQALPTLPAAIALWLLSTLQSKNFLPVGELPDLGGLELVSKTNSNGPRTSAAKDL